MKELLDPCVSAELHHVLFGVVARRSEHIQAVDVPPIFKILPREIGLCTTGVFLRLNTRCKAGRRSTRGGRGGWWGSWQLFECVLRFEPQLVYLEVGWGGVCMTGRKGQPKH